MNFYCCVHSEESLKTHIDYANNQFSKYADKDINYKFICGSKARDKFQNNVINAYDKNPLSKFNKRLRSFSSIWYILNNIENDIFVFNSCTMFIKDIKFTQKPDFDVAFHKIGWNGEKQMNSLPDYIFKYFINPLRKRYTDEKISNFYEERFDGFKIFNPKLEKMIPLYTCALNPKNLFVKKIVDDLILPFANDDSIEFFYGDLAPWLLAHLYYTKYINKIKMIDCIHIIDIERTQEYNHMHYYGE